MNDTPLELNASDLSTGAGLLREARRLKPLIREHAREIENRRRLTPEVHAALLNGGFYRMTMPPQVGAPEGTLPECMRVLEALAEADGSTAWSVWAGLGMPAMSAFFSEEGAREVFGPREACVVGSVAGMGRAVAVPGGYRVSGRWPFVSGIHQATHASGTCFVFDGDVQRVAADGKPAVVVPIWPVGECTVVDAWDTTGLRGTGSDDVIVDDLFVPEDRVIDFSRPPRAGLTWLHYLHVDNAANVTVAAVALGIAAAALSAFRDIGPQRRLVTGELLADSALGRMTLAAAESALAQARGHLYETVELMAEEIGESTYRDEDWFARTSLASVAAADAAIDVTTRVYRAAGTSAIFRHRVFDRCLRDLFTLGAHKTVQQVNLVVYGARFAAAA